MPERDRDDPRAWDWLSHVGMFLAGAAVLLIVVVVAAGVVVWLAVSDPGPDNSKARGEVQRYYDARLPGRVQVDSCRYTPAGDSDYDTYSCKANFTCTRTVQFSVPRAATMGRADFDQSAEGEHPLRFRCFAPR